MLKNNKTFKVTKKNSMLLLNAVNNKTGQSETAIVIWSSRYIRYRMYPSQNSGRAAFPHPALYETHYSTIIRKY